MEAPNTTPISPPTDNNLNIQMCLPNGEFSNNVKWRIEFGRSAEYGQESGSGYGIAKTIERYYENNRLSTVDIRIYLEETSLPDKAWAPVGMVPGPFHGGNTYATSLQCEIKSYYNNSSIPKPTYRSCESYNWPVNLFGPMQIITYKPPQPLWCTYQP